MRFWFPVLLLLLFTLPVVAQDDPSDDDPSAVMLSLIESLVAEDGQAGIIISQIAESGDPLYTAPLIDLARFLPAAQLMDALRQVSGQDLGEDWTPYFEWAAANDIALPDNYDLWKGLLLGAAVDPSFATFFDDVQATARINLVEVTWGGVRVDGIPSLVNARQISPADALLEGEALPEFCRLDDCRYPAPDELVFGLQLDGDARAYPLRLLNWHEMFNDVIGQAPLYDAPAGEVVCQFRAPTEFRAIARQGTDWVQIRGLSAGCPSTGWLGTPDDLVWPEIDGWYAASMLLPNLAEDSEAAALVTDEGIPGHVAGRPVMLSYCTLCGSGILYDPVIDDLVVDGESLGRSVLEFGSTGLLMRSNKLMYDRTTHTVWNALTGQPAFGPLAESGIRLDILPVVVIDWASWLAQHPDTSVLSLDTGYSRPYANGAAYAEYFNDPVNTMFPVWQQDNSQQENKEMVFALTIDDTAKAYPLATIIPEAVVNDSLADQNVVIIAQATPDRDFFEPGGAAVRAYASEDYVFTQAEDFATVIDQDGQSWSVTEDALVGPSGARLERIGGHLAFWFGWYAFYPETLVYESA